MRVLDSIENDEQLSTADVLESGVFRGRSECDNGLVGLSIADFVERGARFKANGDVSLTAEVNDLLNAGTSGSFGNQHAIEQQLRAEGFTYGVQSDKRAHVSSLQSGLVFSVHILRLTFTAKTLIEFPAGEAGNILRGALGTELDRGIFRPKLDGGPSGLGDPPRPFVLRPRGLDARRIRRGDPFTVQVNLFEDAIAPSIAEAFARALNRRAGLDEADKEEVVVDLDEHPSGQRHVAIRFLTPTELKGADKPEFATLFARARDRVSTLSALYGAGPLKIDFREMGERAAAVTMTRCDIHQVAAERRSSRTGQTHPMGGFVGEAEYEGDVCEFVPYLRAAVYTGVGRQTVWGKGEIEVVTSA